jgi:hypothetical protein
MSNRAAAESLILKYIDEIAPGGENVKLYTDLFASMDDTLFEQFMIDLDTGKKRLAVISPNFSKNGLNTERNLKIAKELGHNFFQRVWMPAKNGLPAYLTPIPYLVVDLPLRRQAQLLEKKISIPEDNNSIDNFTGQPTGKSKGSKISYPELQVLAAMGLSDSVTEMIKYRGGDEKGFNAMNTTISRTGGVSLKAIEPFSGNVKSTDTLKAMLNGMHIQNTL